MDRRKFVALLGSLTVAGCSSDTGTPTDTGTLTSTRTGTPTPTDSHAATESPTETPTETATATETETATPVFNPVIYYDTCEQISVQADRYDRVTLFFADSVQQFDAGYRGTNSFRGTGDHAGSVVSEVAVDFGQQTVTRTNPTLESCTATPTPTPTETETESPTATPAQQSEARRGLDVFSYKRVNTDPYEVFIRIENENSYDVQAFVTTEFFGSDGDRYDIQYDFQRIDANARVELVHRYDGPDDRTIEDHTVEVDAERAD